MNNLKVIHVIYDYSLPCVHRSVRHLFLFHPRSLELCGHPQKAAGPNQFG